MFRSLNLSVRSHIRLESQNQWKWLMANMVGVTPRENEWGLGVVVQSMYCTYTVLEVQTIHNTCNASQPCDPEWATLNNKPSLMKEQQAGRSCIDHFQSYLRLDLFEPRRERERERVRVRDGKPMEPPMMNVESWKNEKRNKQMKGDRSGSVESMESVGSDSHGSREREVLGPNLIRKEYLRYSEGTFK